MSVPQQWEADVLLADGGTVHLRQIQPEDADRIVAMYGRLSPESIRYRYFAPKPSLTPAEVKWFTQLDHAEREALVAVLGDDIIAVGRYDRVPGTDTAEVAFVVDDAHHGRGLASVLLEHLAALAADRGIRRFEADVLPDNHRMVRIFVDSGYQASRSFDEDAVHLVFPIEPTEASLAVMQSREHKAEARSVGRLLTPRSVAVVGASRRPDSVGHTVLANLLASGFQGPVYPVNPQAEHVASVRAYPSVEAVPDDIDLAVIAVPANSVGDIVAQCARKRVRGLVVMSGGFAERGPAGREAERALVTTARGNGMRVIGPNCLGVINTAPDIRLNATLAPTLPRRGRAGFFSQSGALGVAILEAVRQRGLGLSTFVSAGNRADVSGNDLLQYWEDDADTDVVLLYLESFGNARKFARLARRIARRKPIVAVRSGGGELSARLGGAAVDSERAVDALYRQAGVIRVDSLGQLFDVAALLTTQPLPAGRHVAVVGNSAALARLAADACAGHGLEIGPLSDATRARLSTLLPSDVTTGNPLLLPWDSGPIDFSSALAAALSDPLVDAVVSVFMPPVQQSEVDLAEVLSTLSLDGTKPLVSSVLGFGGVANGGVADGADAGAGARSAVPSFPSPEVAVAALASVAAYAEWRRHPLGVVPSIPDIDEDGARSLVSEVLQASPGGASLPAAEVNRLLGMYGVSVWPAVPVANAEAALAAASDVGYPVALKATEERFRHRPELGTVRLDIGSEAELLAAYEAMTARLGPAAGLAVQAMAPPGVATVIRTAEDPSFGALISFGVGGVATDLLGDRAFHVLPLTDVDAADLVRAVRAAPLLFGYRGSEPVDVAALEQLLLRVACLADDVPEVAVLELNPVIAGPSGTFVLDATARVAVPASRLDEGPRRMR
jgi:acyl-CoA synthetase (NDP forming)/RimJ/RimL family protein N-acetyltransferase